MIFISFSRSGSNDRLVGSATFSFKGKLSWSRCRLGNGCGVSFDCGCHHWGGKSFHEDFLDSFGFAGGFRSSVLVLITFNNCDRDVIAVDNSRSGLGLIVTDNFGDDVVDVSRDSLVGTFD